MSCCGKRREAIKQWRSLSAVPTQRLSMSSEPLVPIVFRGTGAYLVAGQESRQVYCFSSQDPEQMIDAKDAEALLKTGLFRARG